MIISLLKRNKKKKLTQYKEKMVLTIYFEKAEKPYHQALGVQGRTWDCLNIQDRDLCNNSQTVETVN